ncbi:MAG: HDIG domain-containing metalloprotein [Bacteroidota bacterium]
MTDPTEKHIKDRLPEITKYLLVLGLIVFISFLFPNNARFKYDFDPGQTWHYNDLVAPFDFAIIKPESEVEAEKAAISAQFNPYYELNPNVASQRKQNFAIAFREQLDAFSGNIHLKDIFQRSILYKEFGYRFIDKVYARGVLGADEQLAGKPANFVINVINGNTTTRKTLQSILDPNKIELWVSDSLLVSGLDDIDFLVPLFEDFFQPNLSYSEALTKKFQEEQLASVSTTRGKVQRGELIVTKQSIVTNEIYQKLISFRRQYELDISSKKSHWGVFGGYFLLTSLILGVFILYLQYNEKKIFNSLKQFLFMLMWLLVYSYLVFAVDASQILSVYLIPFCIVPIIIKIFYNERLALFTHIVVVLIASFLSSQGYEFTFLQILAGIVAVLSNIKVRDWSKFFVSMLYIFLAYSVGYLGLSLIEEGTLMAVDWSIYTWIFLNVFLTLLAYPLIPLLERVFGFTSAITLVELSDMDRPLLKTLSLKAPGTLQHSLQVANLAEAAASKIGADQLLVKVAALYHDIGKTKQPLFYIENQTGVNPHDKTSDLESAKVIIEHVTEGVQLAKKNNLPKVLIDFILSHHGTTRVEYFYRNHINNNPGGEVDEHFFRYPGPRPRSKEETILMIADSLEAASKSLKSPNEKDINDLVDKIIAGKITHGQLEDSEMTFEELEICKAEFKKLLKSINHVRIEYPDEKK